MTYGAVDGTATGCTISPSEPFTLSVTSAGTCVVTATNAGDANFLPVSSAPTTVTFAKAAQAIVFTSSPPVGAAVGGGYEVTATGGASGNPVVFSIDPVSSSVCSIVGSHVSFDAAGTCEINADQAGSADYLPAPRVTQSVVVGRTASSLSLSTATVSLVLVGKAVTMRGTLSDATTGVGIAGARVTFSLGAGRTCTATTNDQGVATCSVVYGLLELLTPIPSTYVATYGGSAIYEPSSATGRVHRSLLNI